MTDAFKNYGPTQALNAAKYYRENLQVLGAEPGSLRLDIADIVPLFKGVSSSPTLIRASRKYIVPFNGRFYAYPMMLIDHATSKDLFAIQAPIPNILREGLVFVDGEAYFVKLEDLRRGIVRKSRKLPIPPKRTITYKDFIDGLACTQTSDLPDDHFYSTSSVNARRAALDQLADSSAPIVADETEASQDQLASRAEGSIDLDEESRLIDLAFKEQVGSLYGDSFEETEWENPNDSQP